MNETWTVLKTLEWTAGYFSERGIENARLDAELLLADRLELDRVGLYMQFDRPLDAGELAGYRELVKRRAAREPLQHILGHCEFWSLPFSVNRDVLVPRGDTEILVEAALEQMDDPCRVLDIGTGSGAIAIALASEKPDAVVTAIDISPAAIAVAKENAARNGVADRIGFRVEKLEETAGGPYDLVVSNPPYIPSGDLDSLMPEVRDHEPLLALDGGTDGLDAYRLLAERVPGLLVNDGWLLVEVGIGQAEEVGRLFADHGLTEITTRNDYGGIPRVVAARKRNG